MNKDYVWDDYRYMINSKSDTATSFVCCKYKSGQCGGRGTLENGNFEVTQQHNHRPNLLELEDRAFKRALFDKVTTSRKSDKKIYQQIRLLHSQASIRLPFPKLESNMRK
ncbi:uncharacterized protein LOC122510646 [Leptopilina heterotoma]|uniref:uncharacterized protein LOC122510646 n=1 Tax=Leptopilina heterotoma TaxID=63436 RepID=UPI001CA9CD2F|nr:uncharacterized protein LOC122510646 [Leptopilina heterotoma]